MKNKYRTGDYMIVLFDRHGTKQKVKYAKSFTEAARKGDRATGSPPYASYVIVRVIRNSLDRADPWSVRNDS